MAVAKKKSNEPGKIYVVLSDGECQEGSTLEAMNFIGRMKLNNLIAIVDNNKWQAYDRLLLSADQIKAEFKTAGWNVKEINGHDYKELETVFSSSSDSPILIMANTVLGKGIREMEDKLEWHYLSPTAEQADAFVLGIK